MTVIARWVTVAMLAVAQVAAAAGAVADPEEVLVTASRFARPLTEYAGSATRLTRDDIAARGATHYADLLNLVPGVQLQRGSGQEGLLAIRSPVLTGAGACGAFLILEDGLPLRPTGFCNVNDLFEINTEQAGAIEVLRGPGSAAYGANAVHGIVNVISSEPAQLGSPRLSARWGSLDLRQLGLEWQQQLTERDLLGAYGFWRHDGGFRAASGSDEGKLNLAASHRGSGGIWTWRTAATVLNQETAGFVRGLNSYRDTTIARGNPNPEAFRDAWSARTALQFASTPCERCATTAYALLRASGMQFLQHFLLGKPLEENSHWSLATGAQWRRPWRTNGQWQMGFDASRMDMRLTESQAGPTLEGSAAARAIRPAGAHYDYRVVGTTVGLSASLVTAWTSRQNLAAQLRLENTGYRYDNRLGDGNLDALGAPCAFGGCLYNRPADRSDRFLDLSARLEWRMALAANKQLYASLARGFRPPETTELYRLQRGQNVATLESENIVGAELGLRRRSERWQGSLALYAQEKRHVLLRDANGFNIDSGRTRHQGLEYEWRATLDEHWDVALTGSWARHRYAFDRVIDGGETVVSGRDMDTAPRHLHRAAIEWRGPRNLAASLQTHGRQSAH
jgi:outer membrane receptor protein involved in Fe transport